MYLVHGSKGPCLGARRLAPGARCHRLLDELSLWCLRSGSSGLGSHRECSVRRPGFAVARSQLPQALVVFGDLEPGRRHLRGRPAADRRAADGLAHAGGRGVAGRPAAVARLRALRRGPGRPPRSPCDHAQRAARARRRRRADGGVGLRRRTLAAGALRGRLRPRGRGDALRYGGPVDHAQHRGTAAAQPSQQPAVCGRAHHERLRRPAARRSPGGAVGAGRARRQRDRLRACCDRTGADGRLLQARERGATPSHHG